MVAAALLLASLFSPIAGGVLAGAPIRTSAVILLHYSHNKDVAALTETVRGIVIAMIPNILFATTLYLALPQWGFVEGFIAATTVFVVSALVFERIGSII